MMHMKKIAILFFMLLAFNSKAQNLNYPLNLVTPFDEDTIETIYPMFVWQIDLQSLLNDPRLSQQFILVEKINDQTNSAAINQNQPLLLLNQFQSDFYNYDVSNTELERGKTYVWQINLLYNNVLIQSSDPWQFTIEEQELVNKQFILLKSEIDPTYFETDQDTLLFKIKANYSFVNQQVFLTNEETNETMEVSFGKFLVDSQSEENGYIDEVIETYLTLAVGELSPGTYQLKVNSKGSIYYQKFKVNE